MYNKFPRLIKYLKTSEEFEQEYSLLKKLRQKIMDQYFGGIFIHDAKILTKRRSAIYYAHCSQYGLLIMV